LNKEIAEVGLTHEPCPLRQNHVIIHSGVDACCLGGVYSAGSLHVGELTNLTTKIITRLEFFNFVSEVSRLQDV
jgi:hypothetical protein